MNARLERAQQLLGSLALLVCMAGCQEQFTEPWKVTRIRPLGARIEVEGAPERPRPRLTERFALRQYIAVPGPSDTPLASRYSMDVALCLGQRTPGGSLLCVGEQEVTPTVSVISETEVLVSGIGFDPSMAMFPPEFPALPADFDPTTLPAFAQLDRLVLFGAICVDGRVERIPERSVQNDPPSQLFRCVDNATAIYPEPESFTLSVLLDRGRPFDANQNPSFACSPGSTEGACAAGVVREGEPLVPGSFVIALPEQPNVPGRQVVAWPARNPALPLPWGTCADDPSLPKIQGGSDEHTIRVRFDREDREQYQYEIQSNGQTVLRSARETLALAHALTERGGSLARWDSQLDPDDPDSEAEISFGYTPPKQSDVAEKRIPELGRLVRFYFTLRDQRGGVDFTTRELCLVPPPQQG